MLKALIALLVLANLAFFAWSEGLADSLIGAPGWRSTGDREPERLRRQVHPEQVRVLPADAADSGASASSPVAVATACLEAGPFAAPAELDAALTVAQPAAAPATVDVLRSEQPASWAVYMGRYAVAAAMQRKEDELKRRGVDYEEVGAPEALAPGLALGRFGERADAERALNELVARGVRSARVVELAASAATGRLRVAQADAAAAERLDALADSPALGGKRFGGCATTP